MIELMNHKKRSAAKYPVIIAFAIAGLGLIFWWLIAGKNIPLMMPSGIIAEQQKQLIIFTVILSAVVVVPVFVLLGVFAWKYRAGNNGTYRPEWSENNRLELVWWGIPIIIITILGVVTYVTSHTLDPYRAIASSKPTLNIQVVALQWKWLFIYPDSSIATVNNLTIPVDTPVHFNLSADAPMSAFWIPALGGQIYTMNSMDSQLNLLATKTGEYQGYNTNINGEGYSDMVFTTHVVDEDQYKSWLSTVNSSDDLLDQYSFDKLSEPSVIKTEKFYRLLDPRLYDSISMGHMGAM